MVFMIGSLVQNEQEINRAWALENPKKGLARHGGLWRGDSPYTEIKRLSQQRINELLVNHDKVSF